VFVLSLGALPDRISIKGKVVPKHYSMKAYGGVGVYIDVSLTSELVRGEWSAAALPPGKSPSTDWIGIWVGPNAGLGDMEK
jgi:hypothetical protein